jgi:hypothetical protein
MALAWSRRAAAGVFLLACGCTGGVQGAARTDAGPSEAGGASVGALKFNVDPGLECSAGAAAICVAPSQVVGFGIDGPAGTTVTLSLQGDYADAALTAGQVTLTGTTARVTLESSSTTATFFVAARAGAQSIALRITVATSGSATVEATPVYTGRRPTPEFYATEFVLSTCAELTANAPDASAALWTAGPSGVAIALGVPAGERAAAQVRVGHYAFGCADVDPLVPEASIAVPIQVYDVPMALSLTDLSAVFSFSLDAKAATSWASAGGLAVGRVKGAFFPSSAHDGPALLDGMRAVIGVPADQTQFDQLRQSGGWDAKATSWISATGSSLGARAATWLDAAAADSIGALTLQLGNATGTGSAPVTAMSLGALSWVSAGITQPAPFRLTADANDTLHLSGAIDLASTPLFAHEADAHGASALTGAIDCPSAIALGIDCAKLASDLVGAGVSYGTCDAGCTGNLCAAALAAAWKTASLSPADGTDAVHLTITASAPATIGDRAEPAYVTGGWLGNVSGAGVPTPLAVTGTVVATEPPAAAPP